MKRLFLFLTVKIAVMFMLTVVMQVILALAGPEVREALYGDGIDIFGLAVFALVFGMGGAFISLLISKPMAKWSTGAQVIDGTESDDARWLVTTVERLARTANVKMPEVAIYRGAPNAFATGAFKNSALVAVSDQIMAQMDRSELEAVLGHEMSHVVNGDMVTLTLVQGVLNAFVLVFSRVLASMLSGSGRGSGRRSDGALYMLLVLVLQIALGVLASLVVMWFSRRREYAADAGSAKLLGTPSSMIAALRRLGNLQPGVLPDSLRAMGIAEGRKTSVWSTHPSLDDRIRALENLGADAFL